MTPTNRDELVALMARADLVTKFPDYADDAKWCAHWQWYLDGRVNPNSCVHYSNQALAVARVSAVIDAMIKAGLAVVPNAISYALIDAAIGPSHDIDGDRLIIRRVRGQEGHNALNQVSRRIATAIAAGRIDGGAA